MVDGIFSHAPNRIRRANSPIASIPDPLTDIPRSNARDERVSLDRRARSRLAVRGTGPDARITDQRSHPWSSSLKFVRRSLVKPTGVVSRPARVRAERGRLAPPPPPHSRPRRGARGARTRTRTVGALAAGGRRARRPARGGSSGGEGVGRAVGGVAPGACGCVFGRDLEFRARSTRARARTRGACRGADARIRGGSPRGSRRGVREAFAGANRGIGPGDRGRSTPRRSSTPSLSVDQHAFINDARCDELFPQLRLRDVHGGPAGARQEEADEASDDARGRPVREQHDGAAQPHQQGHLPGPRAELLQEVRAPLFFSSSPPKSGRFFLSNPGGVVSSSSFASARPSDPPLGLLFRSSPRSTADPSLNPPSRFSQRPPLVPRGLRVLGQHGRVPLPRGDGAV